MVTEINHPTGQQFPVGVVHVLVLDPISDTWSYEDLLIPPAGTAVFGGSAAMTDRGGGAVSVIGGGTVGTTVWRRGDTDGTWDQEVVLHGFEPPGGGEALGSGVDVLQLGTGIELAFVGAENGGDLQTDNREGAAYAFIHAPGSEEWVREARLLAPDSASGEKFGASVAIAPLSGGHPGDALALVGAPRRPFFTTREGRALAFRRDGATGIWAFEFELIYPDGNPDVGEFGTTVALLPVPNGEPGELVALVGAPKANVCGVTNTGVAYAYHRTPPNSWELEATLCSQFRTFDNRWGSALALDAHPVQPLGGGVGPIRALVGTEPGPIPSEGHPGGADLFDRTVDELGVVTWTRHAHFASGATGSAADWYGSAVALAGPFALVGASSSDEAAPGAGAVFVYGPEVVANEPDVPTVPLSSLSVHPNPLRNEAEIHLTLARPERVRVALYDVLGREVLVLRDGMLDVGEQIIRFRTSGLPPGVYVARVEGEGFQLARMVTVVR